MSLRVLKPFLLLVDRGAVSQRAVCPKVTYAADDQIQSILQALLDE